MTTIRSKQGKALEAKLKSILNNNSNDLFHHPWLDKVPRIEVVLPLLLIRDDFLDICRIRFHCCNLHDEGCLGIDVHHW